MKLIIAFTTILVSSLSFTSLAYAVDDFQTNINIIYTIDDSGLSNASHQIELTNNTSGSYATNYTVDINSNRIGQLNITDSDGDSASQSYNINIRDKNTLPVIIDIPLSNLEIGEDLYEDIDVEGGNGDLVFSSPNIPDWLERAVKDRDKSCVYCGTNMIEKMPPNGSKKSVATWEHIINDANIVTRENIARCCVACDSSKGTKRLSDWLQSSYCKKHGINKETVAEIIEKAFR